jgi:hypothetical protein
MVYSNNFIAVIKHKGKILRDVNGVVKLPFGSEYSILLKNKDSRTAVANIEIDGEDVMGGHQYIVPGNSTRELKGFLKGLKATHKFRFIRKTKEIAEFRGDRLDDGLVRVEFKFEEKQKLWDDNPWIVYPMYNTDLKKSRKNIDNDNYGGYYGNISTDSYRFTGSTTSASFTGDVVACFNHVATPKADEGITVKGSKVNQDFQYGNVGTLESFSNVIILTLRGAVKEKGKVKKIKRPVLTKTKVQCQVCGRNWKSSLKFCGNCSAALD